MASEAIDVRNRLAQKYKSNLVENAAEKLQRKNLDLIVANDISQTGSGFEADFNQIVLVDREGKAEKSPRLPKSQIAKRILDKVEELLHQNSTISEESE